MMKVYTTRKQHPFKFAEKVIHRYPGYPQHVISEKVWKLGDNLKHFRVYLHGKFICDVITDEDILVRAQEHAIHICNRNGHEYYVYQIQKGK